MISFPTKTPLRNILGGVFFCYNIYINLGKCKMNIQEQKIQARDFIKRWSERGNERQDSQSFWLDLLGSVYGIENPTEYITFEDKVLLDHTSFIDGYIEKTNVLIEQKGSNKDLNKAMKQSAVSLVTPFQQFKI